MEQAEVQLHKSTHSGWLLGKRVQFPHGFPKALSETSQYSTEKIRAPNDKLVALWLLIILPFYYYCSLILPHLHGGAPISDRHCRQRTGVTVPPSRLEQCLETVKSKMLIHEVLGYYFLTVSSRAGTVHFRAGKPLPFTCTSEKQKI